MGTAVAQVISLVFNIFMLLVIGRTLLSWMNFDPYHPVSQFIFRVTEPFLEPVRRVMPSVGMFDLSPIVVIIIASVLESVIIQLIR